MAITVKAHWCMWQRPLQTPPSLMLCANPCKWAGEGTQLSVLDSIGRDPWQTHAQGSCSHAAPCFAQAYCNCERAPVCGEAGVGR